MISSSYNDFNNSSGSRYADSGLISTDFHLLFRFYAKEATCPCSAIFNSCDCIQPVYDDYAIVPILRFCKKDNSVSNF